MTSKNKLSEYNRKRDFDVTPEPDGTPSKPREENHSFVVQKHDATRLHYDFRLEVDGVLVSWAIPRGPSLNPADKRMAVRTEDHPLDYADFEGVIPSGEYGGGPVIVWDRGTYENLGSELMSKGIRKGRIKFRLNGEKLHGAWSLIRMIRSPKETWLLVKMVDAYADRKRDLVEEQPQSVISGKRVEEVGKR
jgi:bifunctional non-homologous end joining protein LigD